MAKLAGVPDAVIERAKCCLSELESQTPARCEERKREDGQMSLSDLGAVDISRELRAINLDTLTPIEAMNLLYELKKKVDG